MHNNKTLTAAMNETHSMNISSASKVSVRKGSNYSLLCEANVNSSISWFFNGLPIMVNKTSYFCVIIE